MSSGRDGETYLAGRTALVTGAARHLGAEIAHALARRGARVAVNYRSSRQEAESVVASLAGTGHVAVAGDVSTREGAEAAFTAAAEQFGPGVDVLVNNAGPFSLTPYRELDPEEFDRIWNANARAAYLTARLAAPTMRERGWGRIVNVSAGSAFVASHSVYSLAKRAVITLTEQLAVELAPAVTVNCVAPGQIAESGDEMATYDPDFVRRTLSKTPAGRLATRAEVADVVAVLCSPLFDMVTGATVPVDGGARLQRA